MNLDKLIAVAKTVANAVVPGAPAAIAAGEAIIDLVKDVRAALNATDQAQLDAALTPLLEKMNVDVDAAIADLGGTGRT
jgi:hypothetical protein